MAKLNYQIIARIVGFLLLFNAGFMALCLPIAFWDWEDDLTSMALASLITVSVAGILLFIGRSPKVMDLSKKDGYVVVTFGWLMMCACGSLPYLISQEIPTATDAFFETVSGYSTTGATILIDIESVSKSVLLWRSLTQWIGGMGIIVLTIAILPFLGIGGMQLFVAEAPGISPDKIRPKIKDTAKRLWYIYLGLTGLELVFLLLGGMSFYDALNHSLTTMATGGFSTKNASTAHFDEPYFQYVFIIFMILAGTNFTLNYYIAKFKWKKVIRNEEWLFYMTIIISLTIIIGTIVLFNVPMHWEESFRQSLFHVVSLMTTTGYVSADYTSWAPVVTAIFFALLFTGGMAGSTAGGVKLVRHLILSKNSFLEFKRQLHPSAVIPVRYDGRAVSRDIVFNILAFIMIYLLLFVLGTILLSATGVDLLTSIGATATCIGNIGPGLGAVGPVDNFADIPWVGKWILSLTMIIGRLELFTVLILFTPNFWRKV
jgi:trk system potassium uptake protein TrkH